MRTRSAQSILAEHVGTQAVPIVETPESEEGVPNGTGHIRYGVREIGTGLADISRPGLGLVRRHLPKRMRTISQRRLVVVLALVCALILGLAVVAATTVRGILKGPASVVVATAAPAIIDSQPGGVGSISAAPQDIATVSLNVQGVTAPIQITVRRCPRQPATWPPELLWCSSIRLPFEQNVRGIRAHAGTGPGRACLGPSSRQCDLRLRRWLSRRPGPHPRGTGRHRRTASPDRRGKLERLLRRRSPATSPRFASLPDRS